MSNLTLNVSKQALNMKAQASKVVSKQAQVTRDIKEHLLNGAQVDFVNNGKTVNGQPEMVYVIDGVNDLEISTKGYIIDKGEVKYPKLSNNTVYIGRRDEWDAINISLKSLITMLNGYIPKGGLVLDVVDQDKGYARGNLKLVNKFTHEEESFDALHKISELPKGGNQLTLEESDTKEVTDTLLGKTLYTRKETVQEYVTEDGAVFPTREIAELHQKNVDDGKLMAQVVLDYNLGYVVAEKVYKEKVVYQKNRPYENFVDVIENNNGIVERASEEVVKFNEFSIGGDPKFAYLFNGKSYTQEQADEIVGMLQMAQDVYANLEQMSKHTA